MLVLILIILIILLLCIIWITIIYKSNTINGFSGKISLNDYSKIQLPKTKTEYQYLKDNLPIDFYYTDKIYVKHMKIILDRMERILKKHNITYWAMFGTLLGIIRHDGFIPWDDDIDLGVLHNELEHILSLKEEFKKNNLDLYLHKTQRRELLKVTYLNKPAELEKNVWIDLFMYFKSKKDGYYHRTKGSYTKLKPSDLFPLKKHKFYDSYFPIPNNSIKILDEQYGKNWDKEIVLNLHHKITKKHKYNNYPEYNFKKPISFANL